ncbi:MAG: ribbon-helix-helix domain-containing protein [Candidatus Paceibacterota bacterium]|jgi:Arc/MetJ-type ribon-helix-helix transcriptional regulator
MRKILNISLPEELAEEIRREVKDGGFASVSEFIRAALRVYREEIILRREHRELRVHKEFQKKKAFQLKSMRDLM